MLLTTRTWGVEIELNVEGLVEMTKPGCSRAHAVYMPNPNRRFSLGQSIFKMGTTPIALPYGWTHHYDGSCGSEFVSPPLNNTALISPMLANIAASRIEYSLRNTGLHVHVSAADLNPAQVLNVVRFCRYFERAIYSFCSPRRIRNKYCKPVGRNDTQVAKAIEDANGETERYYGCNISALARHGTIEFRYAQGSDDFGRIESLVDLFTSVVEVGKTGMRYDYPKDTKVKRIALLDLLDVMPSSRKHLLSQNSWVYNDPLLPSVV